MKNFVTLLLILFCSYNYSQYSKKELKTIKKAGIKIINKGLDLNAVFVPYKKPFYNQVTGQKITGEYNISAWKESLFEAGLESGDFYETSDAVKFQGRYQFEIGEGCRYSRCAKIFDMENNNRLVATISWKFERIYNKEGKWSFIRRYIIEELIRLN